MFEFVINDVFSFIKESSKIGTRVAILLQKSPKSEDDLIKKAMFFAMENLDSNRALRFIKKVLRESVYNDLKQKKKTISSLDLKVSKS